MLVSFDFNESYVSQQKINFVKKNATFDEIKMVDAEKVLSRL